MDQRIERFLQEYRRNHAERTVEQHRSSLRGFVDFLDDREIDLTKFTSSDLRAYLVQLQDEGYAAQTIRGRYRSVDLLYDHLETEGDVASNPAEEIRIGEYAPYRSSRNESEDPGPPWIPRQAVEKLVDSVPQPVVRNRCLVLFIYYTACRRKAASRLRLDELDIDDRRARICSSGGKTTVEWQPDLTPLLRAWLDEYRPQYPTAEESDFVFLTEQSDRIHPTHISRIVSDAAEQAEVQEVLYADQGGNERRKVTADTLRHSFAVHWLQPPKEGSIGKLRDLLAHQDISSTQVCAEVARASRDTEYTDSAPAIDHDAADADDAQICVLCGESRARLETHHVSYLPEQTVEICSRCHWDVHNTDRHDHLTPDRSREDAGKDGWSP